MRAWRNWQTRKVESLVVNSHGGSSPLARTKFATVVEWQTRTAQNRVG